METSWIPRRGSPPIHFDFNRTGTAETIGLDHPAVLAELARQSVELRDGLILNLWDEDGNEQGERDDLVATGVVRFEASSDRWLLEITGWSHQSEGRL
jgi:hypothetical protein